MDMLEAERKQGALSDGLKEGSKQGDRKKKCYLRRSSANQTCRRLMREW
jgi:hypothetical protein